MLDLRLGLRCANEKFSGKNFWGLLMKFFLGLRKFLGCANEKFLRFANENFFGVKNFWGLSMKIF